jgi:hypothetical protein
MSSIDQPPVIRVEMPGQANRPRRTTVWVAAVLAAVALLGAGIIPRMRSNARAAETAKTASSSLANVLVVKARLTSGSADLELPGNIQALNVASIYARTSGYVQQRLVDIGTP